MGFDANGKRIRRRVTAATKTECQEAMGKLREELGQAPRTSKTYTVAQTVADWLADGLPNRSERTKNAYREALTPLLAKIGHRPLRELTAVEVRSSLKALSRSTRRGISRSPETRWSAPFGSHRSTSVSAATSPS